MSPQAAYVTWTALRKHLTLRTITRVTAVICIAAVSIAAYTFHTSQKKTMPPICGVAMVHDPFAVKVFGVADKGGSLLARLLYEPLPSDETFARYFFGTIDVMRWWVITFTDPLRGYQHHLGIPEDGTAGVNPYTIAQPCRPPEDACQDGGGPQHGQPYDPKLASMPGIAGTVAAARRYWTGRDLQIAVAVAAAESGHRDVTGPTVGRGTMRGRWQINDGAHPDLVNASGRDWRNAADDAWMAHEVWAHRGGWSAWTTYTSGAYRSHMDEAARALGGSGASPAASPALYAAGMSAVVPAAAVPAPRPDQPSLKQTPETSTPAPECTTSGGVGGVTIGSWNVLFSNSPDRINAEAGFADVVALQEIRANDELKVPGYAATEANMAVPILWRTDKLELVEWHRERSLLGFGTNKWVVWVVLRNKATGQRFAVVNSHMLVQGGRGWDRQAVKVNRVKDRLRAQGLPVILAGDMNASVPKVRDVFGSGGVGHGIDRIVAFNTTTPKLETLDYGGSDHAKIRATFAAPAVTRTTIPAAGAVPSDFDRQGNPRTVEQAIAMLASHPTGWGGYGVRGHCEGYMTRAYGHAGGYASAIAHWNAPGPKQTSGIPPRGALVFWGPTSSNAYGHVALSVGGGRVISTDFDGRGWAPGRISEGPIESVKFGPYLGWRAPNFKIGSEA
jgi:hypothetical protein